MSVAKAGDKVKVHYRGTLEDDSEFDSSHGRDPLEFTLGEQMVIAGFENAILGMSVGEKKTVRIPPEDAYGLRSDDNLVEIPRSEVPKELELKIGTMLPLQAENGQYFKLPVVGLTDEIITIDANHQLAGELLIFEIELVEVA